MRSALFAVVLSSTAAVMAQPVETRPWAVGVDAATQTRALALFQQGNALFEQSRHQPALAKYREALAVWDHPAIAYNAAVSLIHLDQPLPAFALLEQALRFGVAPLGADTYAQALTYRKLLLGQLALVEIRCDEPGAEVTLDGERLTLTAGAAARRVTPGAHQLAATKAGFLTASRSLLLLPGKTSLEQLRLLPMLSLRSKRRFAVWKPWLVAGAGLALALAVGLPLELDAKSSADRYDAAIVAQCPPSCLASQIPDATRELRTRALAESGVAIGAFAAGGALMLGGVVLLILNQPRVEAARVAVAPGPGGLAVSF